MKRVKGDLLLKFQQGIAMCEVGKTMIMYYSYAGLGKFVVSVQEWCIQKGIQSGRFSSASFG